MEEELLQVFSLHIKKIVLFFNEIEVKCPFKSLRQFFFFCFYIYKHAVFYWLAF